MSETQKPQPIDTCARCGFIRMAHHLANWSNGNLIGQEVLICPTSVFVMASSEDSNSTESEKTK